MTLSIIIESFVPHSANSNKVAFQFLRPEVATGVGNIDTFLVRSNSERMKEVNGASGIRQICK